MIIYRQWNEQRPKIGGVIRLFCEGWYLFGVLPLYIRYINYDLSRPG